MKLLCYCVCWALLSARVSTIGVIATRYNSSDYNDAVQRSAKNLAIEFRSVATSELGVTVFDVASEQLETPVEEAAPASVTSLVEELLNCIVEKLKKKLNSAINILHDMKNVLSNKTDAPSFTLPCSFGSLRRVTHTRTSDSIRAEPRLSVEEKAAPKWTGRFRDLKVKRQYYLSDVDFGTDEDCMTAHSADELRQLYHRVVQPERKSVVILLNDGMNNGTIKLATGVIKELLNVLQPRDEVMFRTVHGDMLLWEDITCSGSLVSFVNATEENKSLLYEHLLHISANTSKIDYESFNKQLRLDLEKVTFIGQLVIVFLTNRSTPEIVNSLITNKMLYEDTKVFISVGFVDETVRFNSNASLRFYREHISDNALRVDIFEDCNPGQVASALLSVLPEIRMNTAEGISAGVPYWDPTQRDFMVPILLRVSKGILGLDLFWSDLSEDVTYLKRSLAKRRAFVLDYSGTVVMHSYFPRPELSTEKIKFTPLEVVENYDFINDVKSQMFSRFLGHYTVPHNDETKFTYSWRHVRNLFIVCIVTEHSDNSSFINMENFYSTHSQRDILYHRLDLFPPKSGNLCRHFKQVATVEQGTVYLSPSSFESPFSYLQDMSEGQDAALTYMQNYLAYLKGVSIRFLSNPGLKNEIRNHVHLLNSILSYFKRQHMQGPYNKYVVRRYAVSESGVLVMFPGTVLEYDYEPVRRPWYTSAVENLGKIILSPPNLDVGGAGYVVSISYAMQSKNYPFMVVSLDVTMGFLYKMLVDSLHQCSLPYVKCFIMNNRGYLISHPGLMDPNGSGPVEQQHITHMESLIAVDMLNHKGFVTKRLCNNFSDRTIQRFYEFNTSLPNVLSKVVSGDHCVHYYIAAIPGTNAFVGVVNATCNLGAFCPCSMVDRTCLNCNRMEQNECECPCECSSNVGSCSVDSDNSSRNLNDMPSCGAVTENNHHKSHYFYNFAENLKPCFDFQCETHTTYSECLGVMGCEWCQLDTDNETPLVSPFCSSQSTCFNGVLGAVTPYGEGTLGHVTREDVFSSYSAIGPIAGCAVTVCLIVAIGIYCYRQNTSGSRRQLYMEGPAETWPERDVQLSRLPSEDTHDHSGQDKLLPAAEAEPPISPYKILTGYKRPNTTGDSDHGYSTMTPHEDSEAMAFSLTEPMVMIDDTMSDISSSVSTSNKILRPRYKPIETSVTVLPSGKNSVIAPVTVHRHMEAS